MITKAAVDAFLSQKSLAVAGVSKKKNKFGSIVYKELKEKGYRVFPVNPSIEDVDGDKCYHNLKELPESVGGVVIVVPPAETVKVVRDSIAAGICRVWLQQGTESDEAIALCKDNGIDVIYGHCILMFAKPTAFVHRAHRYIWRLLGKLPR
jgi:predicted CoA-binding protein